MAESVTGRCCCTGMAVELLHYLRTAPMLPVAFSVKLKLHTVYGDLIANTDRMSGVVGMLQSGDVHVAIGAFSIFILRMDLFSSNESRISI